MAAPKSWADVPMDVVALIARDVLCPLDRFRMSAAHGAWRAAVALEDQPRPRPRLPWLLLPYKRDARLRHGETRVGRFFCAACGGGGDTHRVRVPRNTGGARFVGAYQGGWLFVSYFPLGRHSLINLSTGQERIDLPDYVVTLDGSRERMFILAATLSAAPGADQNCVAAAIANTIPRRFSQFMAFWRMGSPQASCWIPSPPPTLEDVIYHNGAFHFLTMDMDLCVITPKFQEEAPLEQLPLHTEERRFRPLIIRSFPRVLLRRYLVESRGELLMAIRLVRHDDRTSAFRVFQMTAPEAGHDEYSWSELPGPLDGRMLFLGPGCSRSYEVADFPGFQDGVYFHQQSPDMEHSIFTEGCYRCSDNGIWGQEHRVYRVHPRLLPSTYSPPVWFLH